MDINLNVPAIEKLLDMLVSGVGAVGGPILARWKATAEAKALHITAGAHADAIRLIADAQTEARNQFAESSAVHGELTLGNEVESRLTFQEQKRQGNIVAVARFAADQLCAREVPDHHVDHDWIARFFADVQDVTSERMQQIWAKILAGEVETPGRTSLYTLTILKNMTQRDANLFADLCRFVFDDQLESGFLLNVPRYTTAIRLWPDAGVMLRLQSYGLVSMTANLQMDLELTVQGCLLRGGGSLYKISKDNPGTTIHHLHIPCFALTPQGLELYRIIQPNIDVEYLRTFTQFLKDTGNFKFETV